MSLEETNLQVGGVKFKGIFLAILATIVSTIAGTIWTASTLYSRLESVEAVMIPDIEPLSKRLSMIEQQIEDNDVSELQGKLAALGTNLNTIVDQQQKLLLIQEKVTALDKSIAEMETTVTKAELITAEKAAIAGLAVAIVGTFLGLSPAITYGLIIAVSYASAFVKIR